MEGANEIRGSSRMSCRCSGSRWRWPAAPRRLARPQVSTAAPGPRRRSFSDVGGVDVAYVEFRNSAFPYHGDIPASSEDGGGQPFLNVDENGRLGHKSPRGGVHWEDQTYNDRHVLVAASPNFDPKAPGVIVVYFHGNNATLQRDVVARQQAPRQVAAVQAQRGAGRAADGGRRARFQRRQFLAPGRLRRLPRRGRGQDRPLLSQRDPRRFRAHAGRHRRL